MDSFEIDPEFEFRTFINPWDEKWKTKPLYFNQFNGFLWGKTRYEKTDSIIGNLELETWYRFHGIYPENVFSIICYVNEKGKVKQYFISLY